MKHIIAILKDGSQTIYKVVANDFDVGEWAEKRKENFRLLGIVSIRVETKGPPFHHSIESIRVEQIPEVPKPR